ncbi:centromere protein H isoform X2 [Hyla sarda]|uniref:centromere protein H isoform X2 n=1 Tax=Hyla sarda TaxID=327740 RepID=UPI0024C26DC9|nr:centromere protein H isoform X2 [Hyla sarda]
MGTPICVHTSLRVEHMPELFVQLRNTSIRCLQSSLPYTQRGHEDSPPAETSKSCMQLIRLGRQVKQQLMEMKTDFHTRGESIENVDASLNGSLSIACVPLENEICSVKNKELALMRMQTFNALLNVLQKDTTQRRSIMGVMNHSKDICKQIMVLQQNNRQLEEKLVNTRKSRIEIRMKQQELFQSLKYSEITNRKIRDLEAKKHDKGRETIQSDANKIIIVHEIFQRLILSSRLNWAENPYLKNLILNMRDPSLSYPVK